MFGEQEGDSKQICPGEANCERFQGAAGKTHRDKERNACHPCEMFDTKTDKAKKGHKAFADLAQSGMYIRRRRESGYSLGLDEIEAAEFEVLLMADAYIEHHEIRLKREINAALMAGFGLKKE